MPVEVIMPNLGAAQESSTLVRWLVAEGDAVRPGQALFEAESDKATLEVEAGAGGKIGRLQAAPGDLIPAGTVIAYIFEEGESLAEPRAGGDSFGSREEPGEASTQPEREGQSTPPTDRIIATPLARRLARREGVDIAQIRGSGPRGRIVEEDVSAEASRLRRERRTAEPAVSGKSALSATRAAIAARMAESRRTTAQVTLTSEADADALVALRKTLQEKLSERAETISYDALLAWITAHALGEHPLLNASFGEDGIAYHEQVNLGVAVDTERGLLAPVLKNVLVRSFTGLCDELQSLVEKARSGKATPDELSGGTFTITNLGMYRIDAFTPIVNLPECAILGIGRIQKKPVARGERIVLGQTLALSLSFDHRLVDGAPAARFLERIVKGIEAPEPIFPL